MRQGFLMMMSWLLTMTMTVMMMQLMMIFCRIDDAFNITVVNVFLRYSVFFFLPMMMLRWEETLFLHLNFANAFFSRLSNESLTRLTSSRLTWLSIFLRSWRTSRRRLRRCILSGRHSFVHFVKSLGFFETRDPVMRWEACQGCFNGKGQGIRQGEGQVHVIRGKFVGKQDRKTKRILLVLYFYRRIHSEVLTIPERITSFRESSKRKCSWWSQSFQLQNWFALFSKDWEDSSHLSNRTDFVANHLFPLTCKGFGCVC